MMSTAHDEYHALRQARDWSRLNAPNVRNFCWLFGTLMFAAKAIFVFSADKSLEQRVELGMHAIVWLGGAALAGVVLSRLLLVMGEMIDLRIEVATTQKETLALLRDVVVPALEKLPSMLESRPAAKPADLSNLSTAELLEQLRDAKKTGEAEDVLDIRESLQPRLPAHKRTQLDQELAEWFTRFFEKALRSGKAPLVAPTLGKAVEVLADVPEIEHLVAALPMVRQSAGLCVQCGKPYRGNSATCPACQGRDAEESFDDFEDEDIL